MAKYTTFPPSPSQPDLIDTAPVKSHHIIAIRGPQPQGLYLVSAIKSYIEASNTTVTPEFNTLSVKKTVEYVNEPNVDRIEISELSSDILIVLVKPGAEVVGASVIYNIEVPAPEKA